ncbi:hypothetical protein G9A89_021681 [Geosiphon pyriformis]|nr:hypothetical protein G9A89_021681 [Geosiphon pyriformis]
MINGKNLLSNYGTTTLEEVKRARDIRNAVIPTTLREAKPKIKAQILFHFIYGSLGSLPLRKISTRLEEIQQDGPTLLKVVLVDTFVATQAHTFKIKEQLYDLQMKAFKWNVQTMNQSAREIMVDLQAAGHSFGTDDIMIALFCAYAGSTNDEFKNAVMYWKNEWNNGSLTSTEELMVKADGKYDELKKAGTWGKSSEKDEQIIALTARIETLQKEVSKGKGPSSTSSSTKGAGKYAWKYDRSLSASATYVRDGKTFKWCTGPGHNKKAMWVSGHEPGKCTADYKGGKSKGGNKSSPPESATRVDRTALTTMLKNSSPGLTESELDSKVQALLSVLESLWGRLRGHFVCACRLIWELAWLIGVWLWLEIILFMAIPIYPEVEIEDDSLSPGVAFPTKACTMGCIV